MNIRYSILAVLLGTALCAEALVLLREIVGAIQESGRATRPFDMKTYFEIRALSKVVTENDMGIRDVEKLLLVGPGADDPRFDGPARYLDVWRRPYRCILLLDTEQIGIYSLGIDGETSTKGSDPDDVSSWAGPGSHYSSTRAWEFRRTIARRLVLLLVFASTAFLFRKQWVALHSRNCL